MNKIVSFVLVVFPLIAIITSCNNNGPFSRKNKNYSRTTGWKYNDPKNGGFQHSKKYYQQPIGPGLVYIPGGTFVMGQKIEDVMGDWNNSHNRVTVASFFMDETEVCNVDYREYIYWLTRVYGGDSPMTQKALPDTLVWRSELSYNEPYVNNYFRHIAYSEYPVVGVSWEQATEYCKWRTDRVNELALMKSRGINVNSNQKGANNFNTQAYLQGQYGSGSSQGAKNKGSNIPSWNVIMPSYRLPTEAEWEYAAYGLIGTTDKEVIKEGRIYPWTGKWLRNDGRRAHGNRRKDMGKMMANFVRGSGDYMGVAGALNDGGDITVPARTFQPNDFGLYNMAGNVNEWVADTYRQMTPSDVDEFNPYRGNIFRVEVRDRKGNVIPKDKYGRIKTRIQTKEELKKRMNYKVADARNYKDGDKNSRIDYDNDTDNNLIYRTGEGSDIIGVTSLISDKSRVYKGGSWRDRSFWLSPGTRRFQDQDLASADIGFRCAMSQVGYFSPKAREKKLRHRGRKKIRNIR